MRTDARDLLAVGILGRRSRLGDRIELLLRRGRTFSPRVSAAGIATSTVVLAALTLAGSLAPRWIALAEQPSFEVASIKPGDPASDNVSMLIHPGRFTTTNASLQLLIGFAYDVRNHQISGIPGALKSARFTIEAKTPGVPGGTFGSNPARMRMLLQSLLAERFKLAVHQETREESAYDLVVEKSGPKMKEASDSAPGGRQGLWTGQAGYLKGTAASIPLLSNWLSQRLGRSVIDETRLNGKYDFTLEWTPEPGAAPAPDAPSANDIAGPSLFTALRESLGLRLQSTKAPVEIIVIDHVEQPDAN